MVINNTKKKWTQIVFIVIGMLGVIIVIVNSITTKEETESKGLINQPAPLFTLQDNSERYINLTDYNDKGLILNFWASWCTPCVNELPLLNEAYKIKEFDMFAINVGETPEKIQIFSDRYELEFPILFDSNQNVKKMYAVSALPVTIVINIEGTVINRFNGQFTEMQDIFDLVDQLDYDPKIK